MEHIDSGLLNPEDFVRAGGDVLCECGREYYVHPHLRDTGLVVACDGEVVKL